MNTRNKHLLLNYLIAAVWLVNGLFCKVLNMAPRHAEIVATLLGGSDSRMLSLLIWFAEGFMMVWIISGRFSRINAVIQIAVIAVMNSIEFIYVPKLLLWGKANSLFALLFIVLIYYTEFYLKKKLGTQE